MTTTPTFWSGDFLVNTTTTSNQTQPHMTGLANGGFVVVWTDFSQTGGDTDSFAVRAQVFDALGAPVNTEFLVNTATLALQRVPSVTALEGGGFVVVWEDLSSSDSDIRARRFSDDGTAIDVNDFVATSTTADWQRNPQVAATADGGFVVVFEDFSGEGADASGFAVRARLFDANGDPLDDDFEVNTTTTNNQLDPAVAVLANGAFVVVWEDASGSGGDTSGDAVRAQVFNALGVPVGSEFLVNTTTTGNQLNPRVVALANGNFVVAWYDTSHTGFDTDGDAVRAQIFDTFGNAVGGEFFANTTIKSDQTEPDITALADGGFFLAWEAASETGGDTSNDAIRGQRFAEDGTRVGDELLINETTFDDQNTTAVTDLADGRIVVAFNDSSGEHDASGLGIVARILDPRDPVIDGTNGDDVIAGTIDDTTIHGRLGDDTITGLDGDDTLFGDGGNDVLTGGGGRNMLFGGSGDDTLIAGNQNDVLDGGSGDDTILGGNGNDMLAASLGNDTVTGGLGKDVLDGGLGADTFNFDSIAESPKGAAKRDTIDDFQRGQDTIDLFDIDAKKGAGNQKFKFIGKKDFHDKRASFTT